MATASPQKRTNLGGIDRAWQGFEAAIEALDLSELHPQIRIGHALLWTNVLNDAFYRAGAGDYESARENHPGGQTVWGMVFAFNALKHGAALCYDINGEQTALGSIAGHWIWITDADPLVETLDRIPRRGQVPAYRDHIAGRRLSEPFVLAARWFDEAASRWKELAAFLPDDSAGGS